MTEERTPPRWREHAGAFLAAIPCLWYFLQDTSGIKWGDGLEFVAVASHLGIAHPPGYPLFTLLGWLGLQLPAADPYQAFLLVCKVAACAVVAALYVLAWRLLPASPWRSIAAGGLAGAFGFSHALWPTTHEIEVYSTNTAFMLWCLVLLTGDVSRRPWCLAAGGILAGLAVATHLTAMALLPVLLWKWVQSWRAKVSKPAISASALAFCFIPLFLYLSLMWRVPDGSDAYGIFWGEPGTFASWWQHVRGGEYAQYQFLSLQPGVPFTFATWLPFAFQRILMVLQESGAIFFGLGVASLIAGALVIGVGVMGVRLRLKEKESRGDVTAVLCVIGLQALFVFLYNIPDIVDYLLMPLALFFPFVALGIVGSAEYAVRRALGSGAGPGEVRFRTQRIVTVCVGALLLCSAAMNSRSVPPPLAPLAEAWKERLFEILPPGAGLITATDADIYTVWYVQFALGERRDIVAYGANFQRFPWFRYTMPDDPRREAAGFREGPPTTLEAFVEDLANLAIDPMLETGPVYLMVRHPMEAQELGRYYQLLPAAELLTEAEQQLILSEGAVNFPPVMLYEVRPRTERVVP